MAVNKIINGFSLSRAIPPLKRRALRGAALSAGRLWRHVTLPEKAMFLLRIENFGSHSHLRLLRLSRLEC